VLPTGGPTAQVRRLGPKVGGRLALFCIHRVNRVNSHNDSESWWQHHKHCPGIKIIIIIIIIIIITNRKSLLHMPLNTYYRTNMSFTAVYKSPGFPIKIITKTKTNTTHDITNT